MSTSHCYACGGNAPAAIVAEYEGIPFGQLCDDCAPSLAARYQFLGAVFTAFPQRDGQVRLSLGPDSTLAPGERRLVEDAIREVATARGLGGG